MTLFRLAALSLLVAACGGGSRTGGQNTGGQNSDANHATTDASQRVNVDAGDVSAQDLGHGGGNDTCSAPNVVCPKGCVDVQTDNANCGSCGYACPTGKSCLAGMCGVTSCKAVIDCMNAAKTDTSAAQACYDTATAAARAGIDAIDSCLTSTCAVMSLNGPCGQDVDCQDCAATGTSSTGKAIGTCQNASGPVTSDPRCGACVDKILDCESH